MSCKAGSKRVRVPKIGLTKAVKEAKKRKTCLKSAALVYHTEQGPLKAKIEIMTEELALNNMLHSLYNELEDREVRRLRSHIADFRLLLATAITAETQLYGRIHWAQLPTALTEAWTLFKHGSGQQAIDMFKRTLCSPLLPEETDSTQTNDQSEPRDPNAPIIVESDEDKSPKPSEPTAFYAVAAEA